MENVEIRRATPEDAPLLLAMIRDLAAYEKASSEVVASVEMIKETLFADNSSAEALICSIDGKPAGYAVYFYNYSTWLGRNGLYLEDLYVAPQFRGKGGGKAMLRFLAQRALAKQCGRFEWSVLRWNTPAISFYESIGAEPLEEWLIYRLSGKALTDFARTEAL